MHVLQVKIAHIILKGLKVALNVTLQEIEYIILITRKMQLDK